MMSFLHKYRWPVGLAAVLLVWWWFSLPRPLFRAAYATVLEDREGGLLSARIAADGQWRFPAPDTLPLRLAAAIVQFEDRRFYRHMGVSGLALLRATRQNLAAGRVVSGGSTISMQVIRLAQGNPRRTLVRKMQEILLALRLDLTWRKRDILLQWAAHAPFGGNVVGVEAASWRYFGKALGQLSWAECATLAVLPNSPALIHPGRNRSALKEKRDRLLQRLHEAGTISEATFNLSLTEPLPVAPHALPQQATHLLDRALREHGPGRYRTTLSAPLQAFVSQALVRHHQRLRNNLIHNLAALVIDVETGQTLAYLGNAPNLTDEHSPAVDIVTAPRSPGSLLKPMLYGLALQDGTLLPRALLPDVPSPFRDFRPINFDEQYGGVVAANEALARSLNIPMVHLLQTYGQARFHRALQRWNFDFVNQSAEHYGLSLVLGGCEVSLWQVAGWYASLARTVRHYYPQQGAYQRTDWREPHYLSADTLADQPELSRYPHQLGAGAGWLVLEAMQDLTRPPDEQGWQQLTSHRRIAWKTGTSFGFRDAWTVGVTPRYVVAIWAGNADGEGRAGLIGVQAAAPLLFDVLNNLPADDMPWFEPPYDEWRQVATCAQTGYRALPICPVDTAWVTKAGVDGPSCPYHQLIHTDRSGQYRTRLDCASPDEVVPTPWLVLPALEEHYYRLYHPNYRSLPPWSSGCANSEATAVMEMIYPRQRSRIMVPRDLDGERSATVFRVAHRTNNATIYWHLDNRYLGETQTFHTMELRPPPGPHQLALVDQWGTRIEVSFEVVE